MAKGLSARLLVLTIFFVMLAEVLIYVPSIARYRATFLEERLVNAHLAVLALEAAPEVELTEEFEEELLRNVGVFSIALSKPDKGELLLARTVPRSVDVTYDLRDVGPFELVYDAFDTLLGSDYRLMRVIGNSKRDPEATVEVILDQRPLYASMLGYSERILVLSLIISLITAALVYLSLHILLVRPMRRMTDSMTRFRENPEEVQNRIVPSTRSDEVGVAEHELAAMQARIAGALHQKTRLAALGIAVTKINHDLRNILATARLVSDSLSDSEDPDVRRIAPTLVKSIDRAVNLCAQTLNFSREGPPDLSLETFDLSELVEEVGQSLPAAATGEQAWRNRVPQGMTLDADRAQLFRVFANLGHNAIEAGASCVDVTSEYEAEAVRITVADDGPGLPPRARDTLFQPFAGTVKQDGSGLGLAISRDLARAHGGDIALVESTGAGTTFRIVLPRQSRQVSSARPKSAPRRVAAL